MKINLLIEEKSPDLSRLITTDIENLGNVFERYGEEIRIVGGAVRDALLGKSPKDIDLATTATPEKMLKIAEDEGIRVIETGIQHGTVTFVINSEPYEITTLRIDKNTDGRHADVDWTTSFKEDARRRDLTYNAMSVDMDGKLYDYFGGLKDLRGNSTKFVGSTEKRIQEDYLRILRYFRFLSKHPNQKPDDTILSAIKSNADGLKQISGERIWQELSKLVTYPNAGNALEAMCSTGVSANILLDDCSSQAISSVRKIAERTDNPISILIPLFSSPSSFVKFAKHTKIPNTYRNLGNFILQEMPNPQKSYAVEIVTGKVSPEHVIELSHVLGDTKLYYDTKRVAAAPPFPVNGNDLIQAGMKPGPELGKAVHKLKVEWVNSDFKLSKDQLLNKLTP